MPHRGPMFIGAFCLLAYAAGAADDVRVSIPTRMPVTTPGTEFRVESDLVLIPVSVTDSSNRIVTGLESRAFHLFDEQAEQTVVHFTREDAPLSVGIVLDVSESMGDKLRKSREAVHQFLAGANPEDEFFLVEFSDRARLTVPFTADPARIGDRLACAKPWGKTALLDAVRLAMDSMKSARHGRRALLILSDGGDNGSRYTENEVLNRVRESNLWIYAMGIYDRLTSVLPEETGQGQELMEALSRESGGRHYAVEYLADLPEAASRIALELRNQYILGYQPTGSRRDGKYHRVRVRVAEGRNLRVSWRPGYYGAVE